MSERPDDDRGSIPLYFGCWDQVGHGFHRVNGLNANRGPQPVPRPKVGEVFHLAGPPTPWGLEVERLPPDSRRQGAAMLHHRDGWTALAVDDYTVDSRPGSKSVFCFPSILSPEEAIEAAVEHFPRLAKRVGPITLIGSGA